MDLATPPDWDNGDWGAVLAAARGDASGAERAGALWTIYAPLLAVRATPMIVGQIGQSLDGRVATANGHSRYVNGPAALTHLHRLRALSDAVVIGVGTALIDDPQLTVRHAEGADPARVIVDPHGRLDLNAKCLQANGAARIVVRAREGSELPAGVEQIVLPITGSTVDPQALIAALAARGMKRILIEGGPVTLSRFLAAKCVDRLHIMIAPIIIGAGPMGLQLPPIDHLRAALRPSLRTFRLPGGDILFDCDLRA